METTTELPTVGINNRRAEGRDKSDKPHKNLQLKVRKLNPVNTISYVQVLFFGVLAFWVFFFMWFCEMGSF